MPLHLPGKKKVLSTTLKLKDLTDIQIGFRVLQREQCLCAVLRFMLTLWSLKALIACFPVGVSSGRRTWP